jgi:DNA-directed RNA polymerase specialized sigma24 family protein
VSEQAPEPSPETNAGVHRVFATTHWSVVLEAGQTGSADAHTALETLCRAYWYPIYVYMRRKGHGPDEAKDLTQGFFAQLIEKRHLRQADRTRGKFRTFLLAALDHFLASEWRRAHTQKRGGDVSFISLDASSPEERYRLEPADNDTPERKFLRQWALTLLQQTMEKLGRECEEAGKGPLFREVKEVLSGEREPGVYGGIAERLAVGEGAIRVAVHRLRRRYGELLRQEIAQTVDGPQEVEEELRHLLAVLRQA